MAALLYDDPREQYLKKVYDRVVCVRQTITQSKCQSATFVDSLLAGSTREYLYSSNTAIYIDNLLVAEHTTSRSVDNAIGPKGATHFSRRGSVVFKFGTHHHLGIFRR